MGLSAAYKESIKFDNEIRGMEGQRKISPMKIFDNIELLSPHKKICILVDIFASYLPIKQPLTIVATLRYSNGNNKEFQ
jgi:hypothetical protein